MVNYEWQCCAMVLALLVSVCVLSTMASDVSSHGSFVSTSLQSSVRSMSRGAEESLSAALQDQEPHLALMHASAAKAVASAALRLATTHGLGDAIARGAMDVMADAEAAEGELLPLMLKDRGG